MDPWLNDHLPQFKGRGTAADLGLRELESGSRSRRDDPEKYVAEPGLVDAVNVALILGMPLLLTGEPGTGKSQLAERIAFELELGEVLKFDTKSASESQDVFYEFDLVGRLAAAQAKEDVEPRRFITYRALGEAYLQANELKDVEALLPLGSAHLPHRGPKRSVVLIDEIDKAPRDFPNDLLNEFDLRFFRPRPLKTQTQEVVRAQPGLEPILIITSNSEKQLPDPFLRRCVYYHIKFPDAAQLEDIVVKRVGDVFSTKSILNEAVDLFIYLRRHLQRKPTTAELLRWIEVLRTLNLAPNRPLSEQAEHIRQSTAILCKNSDDQKALPGLLEHWAAKS